MNDGRFDGIPLILETPESDRWAEEIRLLYDLKRKGREKSSERRRGLSGQITPESPT